MMNMLKVIHRHVHRYRKSKIDCLSFVYVPATSAAHNSFPFCFFAAAIYSTNEENMCCYATILRCLWTCDRK